MNSVYKVIGLMSGTSLDGLDIAGVLLEKNNDGWTFQIPCCETVFYSDELRDRLKTALGLSAYDLTRLDHTLGEFFGDSVKKFISKYRFEADFISSHGHTIFHQPEQKLTLQIGSAHLIHTITGLPVIYDFRSLDVLLGGQGAPLVPIGDQLLFGNYDCCLNLGGISNLSYRGEGVRIAYDICAFNIVLNYFAQKAGLEYDAKGNLARMGSTNSELITYLNKLSYYTLNYPKSLGFESIEKEILSPVESWNLQNPDLLKTFNEHFADKISECLSQIDNLKTVLVTGGGAYNEYFIELLQSKLPGIELILPEDKIIKYKEALIFALIGVLRKRGEENILCSVTGAKRNSCSGSIIGKLS